MQRQYGLKPDRIIDRPLYSVGVGQIAAESDLEHLLPEITDQYTTSACTMFSGVAMRYAEAVIAGQKPPTFDPYAGYVWERQFDGTFPRDCGSSLATTVEVGERIGFLPDANPPNMQDLDRIPTPQDRDKSQTWRIQNGVQVPSRDALLEILSSGHPVHGGIAIYRSFESDAVAKTGIVPMPGSNDDLLGYHGIVFMGHNNDQRRVKCRNSWGKPWGDHGYFYLPYEYFDSTERVNAMWQWTA